jgi:acyl CoA:acetate/3-ketoacid CoA transferase beta subunit
MDPVLNPAATKVLVIQNHMDIHWGPKMKEKYDLPLTGKGFVHMIITGLACFDVRQGDLVLRDYNPDSSIEEIRGRLGRSLRLGGIVSR